MDLLEEGFFFCCPGEKKKKQNSFSFAIFTIPFQQPELPRQ